MHEIYREIAPFIRGLCGFDRFSLRGRARKCAFAKLIQQIERLGGVAVSIDQFCRIFLTSPRLFFAAQTSPTRPCRRLASSGICDLRLQDTRVTESGMKEIGKLSDLRSLNVPGVPVGAAGLSHLKELRKLKRLVLSGAKIDAKAAVQLGGFVNLEELRLYECQITDELIERLKRLRKLRALSLHSCDGLGANGNQPHWHAQQARLTESLCHEGCGSGRGFPS